jgi:asparagine synthase (glutamine-hydrolysing)
MCGISGIVGRADESVVRAMIDAMRLRGPDDQGVFVDEPGRVCLGHRRLAIIDTSSAGHQPMSFEGRYTIVFNGEIYNFRELRAELERKGCTFITQTDTEVILAAYVRWGDGCLRRLRGMFAFAVWDARKREMFLARDRFGIKPLYYACRGGIFAFASEIHALLATGVPERRVDPQALWYYLSVGSVVQPRTIVADVQSLPPGHFMLLRGSQQTIYRYWDIAENTLQLRHELEGISEERAVQELRHLLEEATRYHLIADVPVGAFLSGGVDSTAVVGLMARMASRPIQTYSIGFESQFEHLNELKWAQLAAKELHTDHTEVVITEREIASSLDRLIGAIDQPSVDGTNTFFVSEAARKGVTVAISGLGGDELFCGYSHFRPFARAAALAPAGTRTLGQILGKVGFALPRQLRGNLQLAAASPIDRYARVRLMMNEEMKRAAVADSFRDSFSPQALTYRYEPMLDRSLDAPTQVSYVELRGYLADTLLRDSDVMSMAHSLELRPVLLDHAFAEFAFALPGRLKLQKGRSKPLFVDAVRDVLPKAIVTRPKMGFELPLVAWLRTSLRARADDAFESPTARSIFSRTFLEQCDAELNGRQTTSNRLWAYFILIEYLRLHRLEVREARGVEAAKSPSSLLPESDVRAPAGHAAGPARRAITKQKRLAIYSPGIGVLSETFITRHILELAPGNVSVLCETIARSEVGDSLRQRINVHCMSEPRHYWQNRALEKICEGRLRDRFHSARRFLRKNRVDVVLGEYMDASLPMLRICREAGIPFFVHAHGYDVSQRLRDPFYRKSYLDYREAAGIITMSEYSRQELIKLGLSGSSIHVIPYGVDVPERTVRRAGSDGGQCIAVGRMVGKKAPTLLLESFRRALAEDDRLRLTMVGDGPLLVSAQYYVHSQGLQRSVTLAGAKQALQIPAMLDGADLFLQHSVVDPVSGDSEGLPVSIIEAMAHGLPVVSTRHAGIPEAVVHGETGLLVEEGDLSAMAEAILRLAHDAALRDKMGLAAHERARAHFTWQLERDRLREVLGLAVP